MSKKSRPTRILQTDINPDGVRIVIDWDTFRPGASVFIPCLDTKEALRQVMEYGKFTKDALHGQVVTEAGYYGIRIWRMK